MALIKAREKINGQNSLKRKDHLWAWGVEYARGGDKGNGILPLSVARICEGS